ncbi:MAG: alanine racemase [Clostridia bacterium]|nr:alanine racemase [Clostridia bacterium]
MMRRTWAEVDLSALRRNYRVYRDLVAPRPVMAVIKADAYGHGAVPVARALREEGVCLFAVASLSEGIQLRKAGIEGEILILGHTPAELAPELTGYDLIQTVVDQAHGEALAAAGLPVRCHVAVDTGMGRIGLRADDPDACEETIRFLAGRLSLEGIFTHLSEADSDGADARAFTRRQIALFEAVAARVGDLRLVAHCLNSAGGMYHQTNLPGPVRLGITLYGQKPDASNILPAGIHPVLSLKSTVSMVKRILPGDSVGYGRTFIAEAPMRLATVSAGYADGVHRLLSNNGAVLIRGKRAPIVGRVCMDQITVDVTGIPEVNPGDIVTLIGRDGGEEITADEFAARSNTISYEILCSFPSRVERVYFGQ